MVPWSEALCYPSPSFAPPPFIGSLPPSISLSFLLSCFLSFLLSFFLTQSEQETQKNSLLQNEFASLRGEMSTMKARERQLLKDVASLKEARNSLEEDLLKMRNNNAVLDLQVKELQGELEVEQNFATLYKTQVRGECF